MSANYWDSSQKNVWLMDRSWLHAQRSKSSLSTTDRLKVNLYYTSLLHKLARRLQLRQQVIATALTYMIRFFVKNEYDSIDPFLVAVTCAYVACKIEECPHHLKTVIAEARHIISPREFPYHTSDIAEFEHYLFLEMDCYLVVYHPYRPLQQFIKEMQLDTTCLQTAWYIVNDTYRTDIPLLYPPHMIALAALYLTAGLSQSEPISVSGMSLTLPSSGANLGSHRTTLSSHSSSHPPPSSTSPTSAAIFDFFGKLHIDMRDIIYIIQDLLVLYRVWEDYSEEETHRFLRKRQFEDVCRALGRSVTTSSSNTSSMPGKNSLDPVSIGSTSASTGDK